MNITKTIETKSRNSDWTLFAVDGEVKAWYAWIKATLSFLKLSAIPSSPLALRGDGTQSQNQSDVRPPGDRLLSKNAWMPWDLGGGGLILRGRGWSGMEFYRSVFVGSCIKLLSYHGKRIRNFNTPWKSVALTFESVTWSTRYMYSRR